MEAWFICKFKKYVYVYIQVQGINDDVETLITCEVNNNDVISKVYDFLIGDSSYWKSEYNKSIKALNEIIGDATDTVEHFGECSIDDTRWLSYHHAFHDIVASEFEIVGCKQKNEFQTYCSMSEAWSSYI